MFDTFKLRRRAWKLYRASQAIVPLDTEDFFKRIMEATQDYKRAPRKELLPGMFACVEALYEQIFDHTLEPPPNGTPFELAAYIDRATRVVERANNATLTRFANVLRDALTSFTVALPQSATLPHDEWIKDHDHPSKPLFTVPLQVPNKTLDFLIAPFFKDNLFADVRERLLRNMFEASKLPYTPNAPDNARLKWPSDYEGNAVDPYLNGTPLRPIFKAQVPFEIPPLIRFEGHWICSPPGTGKSTTLMTLLKGDFDRVAKGECSVVVMESKRDLLESTKKLARFGKGGDLHGRLVLLDLEDVEYPIALNLFDVGLSAIKKASPADREALLNSTVSMLDYVFRALLGAELTSRQSTLFNFTVQLLLEIPEATLDTFIDLMKPKGIEAYAQYLDRLDTDTKQFFSLKFNSDEFKRTKGEITDRLFAVKKVRSLARMFAAPRNKLDFYEELGKGRVILINCPKAQLGEEGVEIITRFFVAMILLAAQKRQFLAKENRLPAYVFIDECHDTVRRDEKIPILLDQARSARVALVLAHQRLDQITPPVLNALMSSTAIKFAAQTSDANASALARNMGTTADFILKQPPYSYAVHIRGVTREAVSLQIPPTDFAKEPHMSDEEYRAIRDDMRKRYAIEKEADAEQPPEPEKTKRRKDGPAEW